MTMRTHTKHAADYTGEDWWKADFFGNGSSVDAVSRLVKRVRHQDARITVQPSDRTTLVVTQSQGQIVRLGMGERVLRDSPQFGAVSVLGADEITTIEVKGPTRVLMSLPNSKIVEAASDAPDLGSERPCIEPRLHCFDPTLEGLVYRACLVGPDLQDDLFRTIAYHLIQRHSRTAIDARSSRLSGGIPTWKLRKIDELIDAEMARPIHISDLASAAGLSPFHFGRQFHSSVGVSPYRYVVSRRLERAMLLLNKAGTTAESAAAATGFSCGAHLAVHMRRLFGISPGMYKTTIAP